ncbi:hypothetical protein AKJ45_00225 [candidate division MSBL1 archaeon SCGC-AAA261F19]|uniref:Uncharacterized protein n=1 Tax=candidate division MSBL1 archaeon SCGC-AAA261F19 TaxID=1698275 RepID=A0A133VBR8_9EURY|nr:hypothetical protein AKJ45_00225 [candidate division MSBL1 archaeon SCGC-AAA261F19]
MVAALKGLFPDSKRIKRAVRTIYEESEKYMNNPSQFGGPPEGERVQQQPGRRDYGPSGKTKETLQENPSRDDI